MHLGGRENWELHHGHNHVMECPTLPTYIFIYIYIYIYILLLVSEDYVVSNGATLESVYNSNGRYTTSILPIDDVFKVHLKIQGM